MIHRAVPKLAVLVPTRGRVASCAEMLSTALRDAKELEHVTFYLGVDGDDPALGFNGASGATYTEMVDQFMGFPGFVELRVVKSGKTVSEIWNELAGVAVLRGADILLMGNDDQRYETEGWDLRFRQVHGQHEDGVYVAWCDDGMNGAYRCAFPAVSRRWYETLGYFAPEEGFRFFYNDTWIHDLGGRVHRLRYMPDVRVRHSHFTEGGVRDATTLRNRSDGQSADDRRRWEETEKVRVAHAQVLRGVMR